MRLTTVIDAELIVTDPGVCFVASPSTDASLLQPESALGPQAGRQSRVRSLLPDDTLMDGSVAACIADKPSNSKINLCCPRLRLTVKPSRAGS